MAMSWWRSSTTQLTVKELDTQGPTPFLRAHHPDFAPIALRPG